MRLLREGFIAALVPGALIQNVWIQQRFRRCYRQPLNYRVWDHSDLLPYRMALVTMKPTRKHVMSPTSVPCTSV